MRNYETNVYDYIEKDIHVVKAVTTYEGKAVYAYAKCDPNDNFDLEFGTKLALKRLDYKIALKRAAHAKEYAKLCRADLEHVEHYKKRLKKTIESAEISYSNRMVEVNQLENEIAEMLININEGN